MTTTKKLVMAVVALSLALVCVIGGTLAYLVASSNTVTNTFTYGEIALTLTETEGTESGDVREFGKVVPGATIKKDPTVTVTADSENCYVYVKVVNNVVLNNKTVVTCNIDTTNWVLVGENSNGAGSVVSLYRYKAVVNTSTDDQSLPEVFKTVTFGNFESKDITVLDAITEDIVITAYAHQAANTDQGTADVAAKTWAGID